MWQRPQQNATPATVNLYGVGWNNSGGERVICVYALQYTGGVPGGVDLVSDLPTRFHGPDWWPVVGMPGAWECLVVTGVGDCPFGPR